MGTWGSITTERTPTGWRARTRYRDWDGTTRQVNRSGRTAGAARANLTAYLSDRSAPSGDYITADSRLSEVAEVWFTERADLTVNTRRRYRQTLDLHVLPGVGNLRVREATVSRLDAFVKATARNTGAPTAKLCVSVLSGIMGLAVRHGAARTNPVRDIAGVTVTTPEPRAMSLDEVRALRATVQAWQSRPAKARGRRPTVDLLDLVDLLLATGARIGELLALRWSDVDLDAGTVTLAGTIVMSDSSPSRPTRQDHPKGKRRLTLLLPRHALDVLVRRRIHHVPNVYDLVFPSTNGTLRDPGNVRKQLHRALADTGLDWVTPHTFRKTVATVVEADADLATASRQLGHRSEQVTARHYVQPRNLGPDARTSLDQFAPHTTDH